MQFINQTGNTVYLGDIDKYIPFLDGQYQSLETDFVLKSRNFQTMVVSGGFEIIGVENARIERNLYRKQQQMAKLKLNLGNILNDKASHSEPSPQRPKTNTPEVVIKGHMLEGGGYAKVNRNLATGLKELGCDVKVEVVHSPRPELSDIDFKKLTAMWGKGSPNAIRIDSVIPTFGQQSSGKMPILYTTIESYTIPQQFLDACGNYREIWVTSDFCEQKLKEAGVRQPIFVLPDSINTKAYSPEGERFSIPNTKGFVFLSVFGWSFRKGYDVLLKSYLKEFTDKDDVTLLIVSKFQNDPNHSGIIEKTINEYIKEYGGANPPHIARCSKFIPESRMPMLYRAASAFVLFTRGEGFGLPFCEASLCGLPVIGTNVSGQAMFLNRDNSYLLDMDTLVKIPPGTMHVHYWDNQLFPSLESDEVIREGGRLMREVFENYSKAKAKNEGLRSFILSNYSIDEISKKAKERIDNIWSQL